MTLSLIGEMLADAAVLSILLLRFVRIGIEASGAVAMIYVGALVLAVAVICLGAGLLRPQPAV